MPYKGICRGRDYHQNEGDLICEDVINFATLQIPRFAFEKFPGATPTLTTQMKSVGEAMAIGRTFQESFQKAMRSLETGLAGWSLPKNWKRKTRQQLEYNLRVPNPDRMLIIKQASDSNHSLAQDAIPQLMEI